MNRRCFLTATGMLALSGCLSSSEDPDDESSGSEFQGPTEEDSTYVDLQYREYTDDEVSDIRDAADSPDYRDLFRNIDSERGREVTYDGVVGQTIESENAPHFSFLIFIDGDVDKPVYVSWVGDRFVQNDRVEFWGQVLGPEVYQTGAGSQKTVPAIAAADMELRDGS